MIERVGCEILKKAKIANKKIPKLRPILFPMSRFYVSCKSIIVTKLSSPSPLCDVFLKRPLPYINSQTCVLRPLLGPKCEAVVGLVAVVQR